MVQWDPNNVLFSYRHDERRRWWFVHYSVNQSSNRPWRVHRHGRWQSLFKRLESSGEMKRKDGWWVNKHTSQNNHHGVSLETTMWYNKRSGNINATPKPLSQLHREAAAATAARSFVRLSLRYCRRNFQPLFFLKKNTYHRCPKRRRSLEGMCSMLKETCCCNDGCWDSHYVAVPEIYLGARRRRRSSSSSTW